MSGNFVKESSFALQGWTVPVQTTVNRFTRIGGGVRVIRLVHDTRGRYTGIREKYYENGQIYTE